MNQLTGFIIVILSTVFYALMYPMLKKAGQQIPPFAVVAVTSFIVFVLSVLASILFENGMNMKGEAFRTSLYFLIAAGVINFVAFWLVILGYKYFPIWQVTMFALLTPIISGVFAYFILGEKITINLFLGLLIVGFGLFIALKP